MNGETTGFRMDECRDRLSRSIRAALLALVAGGVGLCTGAAVSAVAEAVAGVDASDSPLAERRVPTTAAELWAECAAHRSRALPLKVCGVEINGTLEAGALLGFAALLDDLRSRPSEADRVVAAAQAMLLASSRKRSYVAWVDADTIVLKRALVAPSDPVGLPAELDDGVGRSHVAGPTSTVLHIRPEGQWHIADERVVSRLEQHSWIEVVRDIDPTLADWQRIIESSAAGGQTVTIFRCESGRPVSVLRLEQPAPRGFDAEVLWSEYRFDCTNGCRLASIVAGRDDFITLDIDYIFTDCDARSPLLTAERTRNPGADDWRLRLFIFDSGARGDLVDVPSLVLPAVRVEIETAIDGPAPHVVRFVLPPALAELPPDERLAAAIFGVFQHWGSRDVPDFDLNGDGVVDAADIERARREFGRPLVP